MERRLLFALPAGAVITAGIFLGLDFALRLPEAKSGSIYSASGEKTQPKRGRDRTVRSGEPVHSRDRREPPPIRRPIESPNESPGDLEVSSDMIAWQMEEPLPVKTDTNTWRSTQCGTAEHGGPGRVDFEFVVGGDGQTKDVRVLEASSPKLARCAAEAARSWRWQPVFEDGRPVESPRVRRSIVFRE